MSLIELLKQYKKERKIWKDAGCPMRTKERIQELHSICEACPNFNPGKGMVPGYDQCDLCQCNLHPKKDELNKLSWATTHCPDNPPRWTSETPCE